MHSNLTLQNFDVKIFSLGIHQIYIHKYLAYEYFHAQIMINTIPMFVSKLEFPNITVMCNVCTIHTVGTYSGGRLVHLDNINILSRIDLLCFTDCNYYSGIVLPCTEHQKVAIYKL